MANPIKVAVKGKGFLPMLARGGAITSRYGFTAAKMDYALAKLSEITRQYACSATLPVTASALAASPEVALKYHNLGMEVAIHGLQHIDYSAISPEKQSDHIRQSIEIFQNANIPATGFRCPYLRWNEDILKALRSFGITYDSSQALAWDVVPSLETDEYHRVLDFYRSQSAHDYPALPRLVDGLVRIPYCLPDDEALVERLHLSSKSITEVWLALFDCIYQAGELFTLGIHPERVPLCTEALQSVLKKARSLSPGVWIARLDEIASWYLALGNATFELEPETEDVFRIRINAPDRAAVYIRTPEVHTTTQPWMQGYQFTFSRDFTFRSSKRPVIAVAPDASPQLKRFLQYQGYLVEVSTEPSLYSLYLNQTSFQEVDERPLIAKLEQEDAPLIRLSRWPDAARSALTITGDVDAFTILDYGRRIWYR